MFKCHVCNSTEYKEDFVNEILEIEGKHVLVKDIPARICVRCGDVTISRETTERIRRMVQGGGKPRKSITVDVFEYGTTKNEWLNV